MNSLASTGPTFAEIETHLAQKYCCWYWASEEKFHDQSRYRMTEGKEERNSDARANMTNAAFPGSKEWKSRRCTLSLERFIKLYYSTTLLARSR